MLPIQGEVHLTVTPWIGDDDSLIRQLQLSNLSLDSLVPQGNLLDQQDFITVHTAVNIGTKPKIALDCASGQIYNRFMEFILRLSVRRYDPHLLLRLMPNPQCF